MTYMSNGESPIANSLAKFLAIARIRDADLAEKISDSLNRGLQTGQAVDEIIMSMSKLVESRLKEAIENATGTSAGDATGSDLLTMAVGSGLIRSRDEPLYHFLFWYFGERRNPAHHDFGNYSVSELLNFIMNTQDALEKVDEIRRVPRYVDAQFHVANDMHSGRVTITVDNLSRAGNPITEGRLEAVIRRPDGVASSVPLLRSNPGSPWVGSYEYRGLVIGTYRFRIQGSDQLGLFTTSSGSTISVSPRTCVKCTQNLDAFSLVCPRCGANQIGGIFNP